MGECMEEKSMEQRRSGIQTGRGEERWGEVRRGEERWGEVRRDGECIYLHLLTSNLVWFLPQFSVSCCWCSLNTDTP